MDDGFPWNPCSADCGSVETVPEVHHGDPGGRGIREPNELTLCQVSRVVCEGQSSKAP